MSKKVKKKKKNSRVVPQPATAAATVPAKPPGPWTGSNACLLVTIVLLGFPWLPWHPLYFLPPVLFWPMYGGMVAACWTKRFKGDLNLKPSVLITFESLGLFFVFGSYLLLKLIGLHASGTDDNIYYYMASRMAAGAMPYRDFFFSHPPFHLLVPALVFKIFGLSIVTAKIMPVMAQAVAGLFLYLTVRPASRVMALLALLLQLTAYQVLMGSTDMNGENLLTAFLMASLFFAVTGRYLTSGVLAGLGLGCTFYGLAAVIAFAVAAAFSSKRAIIRYSAGFAAGFGGVMIPFAIIGGSGFVKGVFAYHLAKPVKGAGRVPLFESFNPFTMAGAFIKDMSAFMSSRAFYTSLYYHAPAYLAAMLSLLIMSGRSANRWWRSRMNPGPQTDGRKWNLLLLHGRDLLSGTPEGLLKLCILAVVLFLCQYAALNEFYDYYFVPMMGFLAVGAAFFLWQVYKALRDTMTLGGLAYAGLLVGLFSLHGVWADHLRRVLWPQEYSPKNVGKVVKYDWREPKVPKTLAHLSRMLFFQDQRITGRLTPYYLHYMWNKRLTFSELDRIADYIRSNLKPDETITGASTIAPLLALTAGCRMAGDEADTNAKRFITGLLTEKKFFNMICADRIRYIVSAPHSLFSEPFMTNDPFIRANFKREITIVDKQLYHRQGFPITLYRLVDTAGLPEDRVCEFK